MSDRAHDPFGLFSPEHAAADDGRDAAPDAGPSVELAAYLAGRICHDLISPASAIVSGVDLLEDPTQADMTEDALNLIGQSARKLVAAIAFARVAFGASAAAETFNPAELHKLAAGVFAHMRAELDWRVAAPALNKPAARAILNLAQIGGSALPNGGVAAVTATQKDGEFLMAVDSAHPRARLRPEVIEGLKGEPMGPGGLHGHWIQAYYLQGLLKAAGGRVDVMAEEGRVVIRARVPA